MNGLKLFAVVGLALFAVTAWGQYAAPRVMCEITFPENRNPDEFECLGDLNQDGYDDLAYWDWQGDRIDVLFGGQHMDGNVDYTIYSDSSTGANILLAGLVGNVLPNSPNCIAVWAHNFQDTGSFINVYTGAQQEPMFTLREDRPDWKLRMLAGSQHGMQPSDFNGDGYDDLFVSRYETINHQSFFEIYFGGESLDTIPDWQLSRSGILSAKYSCGNDLNGDGCDDLMLYSSLQREYHGGNYSNMIFFGGDQIDTLPTFFYDPANFEDGPYQGRTGEPGRMIGDLNCDGYCDWIDSWEGGWWAPEGARFEHGVFVFYGGTELDSVPDLDSTSGLIGSMKEILAGDFNGDGNDDVIYYEHSSMNIYIKFGTRWILNSTDLISHLTSDYDDRFDFGEGVVVGDFDGDGADDFVLLNGNTRPPKRLVIFNGSRNWPASVADPSPLTPSTLLLSPAYPNPFNSTTRIEFGLSKPAPTRLQIFDPLGRWVADLMPPGTSALREGKHSAVWNATGVPAGEYLIRLQAGDQAQVTGVQVVK